MIQLLNVGHNRMVVVGDDLRRRGGAVGPADLIHLLAKIRIGYAPHMPVQADLLPFEDFDMAAHVVVPPGRRALIRRAITSGPGEYDIVVGWAVLDARNRPTRTGGLRHALSLPPAQSEALALGSVILADEIRARTEIYPADQQTAHPYTIGGTEIEPAGDRVFSNDERLAVVFQIFNAVPTATGKPDVGVAFRLFRKTEKGEEPAAALAPLDYTEGTLPVDFNLNLGRPLLAAFAAPALPR